MAIIKKLIEVALPLEIINSESSREKSIHYGHPNSLHLWWARRPLAAARAVIWASLVDDPSSHPEKFPTIEEQRLERERLFAILSRLVTLENINDEAVLSEARAEIFKSTNGNPPHVLDPFAGGGAIPIEGQRLGLHVHAHDLNPVALSINKAMLEIPRLFSCQAPVNPESTASLYNAQWNGSVGLAADVQYYGNWLRNEAYKKLGDLYPDVQAVDTGKSLTPIAWLWARTVTCPNPACGCTVPLVKSFTLSRKAGKETFVKLVPDGKKPRFIVCKGKGGAEGTVNRKGAVCPFCNTAVSFQYIRTESNEKRISAQLLAIVAEGKNGRQYCEATLEHERKANVEMPEQYPSGSLAHYPGYINPNAYGFTDIASLFSNRQLVMLTTLADLVRNIPAKVTRDARAAGMYDDGIRLSNGGRGATAYGDAVSVYLGFLIDKLTDYNSTISSWNSSAETLRGTFGLTGISMSWDYAEANPFSQSCGNISGMLSGIVKAIERLPGSADAEVSQFNAQVDSGLRDVLISTDPPYYSNVPYAAFADYFYVWMRASIGNVYPQLFGSMLTPKIEELTADPYLRGGKDEAAEYFESGMLQACKAMYLAASDDYPVTIYYAFKQTETDSSGDEKEVKFTGWETMLSAIIQAGFSINGTWPVRTEKVGRSRSNGANALASSIVLVCRKRGSDARAVTRREFINALHREMRPALEKLQSANIAPVDLAQSAIGPGIGVYSRYKNVLESDGTPMSVRAALQIINQELDSFYNEQEGEMDRESRFCVDLFNQSAFNTIKFGDADILARAKNTSVQALADHGVLTATKGQVRLLTREEIPEKVDATEECTWLLTQQLARAMEKGGVKECANIVVNLFGSNAENAKALAYRLYTICERKNWAQEGFAYNNLVVAWPDIQAMAAAIQAETPVQLTFEF